MSLFDELENLDARRCPTCEWFASRTTKEQAGIDAQIVAINDAPKKYGRYADLRNVCSRYGLQDNLENFRHHCQTHVPK